MYIATQREMQLMDQYTMETLGLPGIVLMENAGARVVEEIQVSTPCPKSRVLVLAGSGNNGGDGFVIARKLNDIGIQTTVYLATKPERIKGDAKVHFDVYLNRRLPILYHSEENKLENFISELHKADIVVDALLGTGVKGPVRQPMNQLISLVNDCQKFVLSVDIPSGVNSDDGSVEGVAIKADKTVTFVFPKRGFFLKEGPAYIGEWKAVDISVPPSLSEELGMEMPQVIDKELVQALLPKRPPHGHKGTFGHTLVIGGSRSYVGAPIFSAKSALHGGCGLVTLAIPECIYPFAAAQNPESLFLPLPEDDGHFSRKAIAKLSKDIDEFDSIAIGPGMGRFTGGEDWMQALLTSLTGQTIVVDADALYLIRNHMHLIHQYKGKVIFTPHPGEMARLVNKTVKEVEADRIFTAITYAKKHKVFLLLKGHRTVIAAPDGQVFINPYGHDALGKGGSGDVLTGLVASFIAQGASPLQALISGSFLHAKAGEERARRLSHYGVTPLDLIDGIREQLLQIESK